MTAIAEDVPEQQTATPGVQGPLGIGTYRAFAYDRGGMHRIGEITPIAHLQWNRVRDDISQLSLTTAGFGRDCCDLMADLHGLRHELVLYRHTNSIDGWVRVWEGPITLLSYQSDHVEITAHDVMYYLYRRIIRDGYDDRYIYKEDENGNDISINNNKSVIERSVRLLRDGLARFDPNVAPFITRFDRHDDAKESRRLHPMQKTVWEEIDDFAANGGLDYTTVGRRIMLWDTHNVIGRLPPMGDDSFLASPVITEYGSALATFSVVSDGDGNFGTAGGYDHYYGYIEVLSSNYSSKQPGLNVKELKQLNRDRVKAEAKYRDARSSYLRYPGLSQAEATDLANWETERNSGGVLPDRQKWLDAHIEPLRTRANEKKGFKTAMEGAKRDLDADIAAQQNSSKKWHEYMKVLRSQALRNLEGRNPTPVTVRIPDNSQLNPSIDIGIQQLVPGVWVPLRSESTCKQLRQWQKLDEVSVTFDPSAGESVTLTLSPAPDHGRDPIDVDPTE